MTVTISTPEQAVAAAEDDLHCVPGTCQKVTRGWYHAPSVGDVDGDGDADAVDGWASEPTSARHPGDRNPPFGAPLAFAGGSRGFGHRCIYKHVMARSTDMNNGHYSAGTVGNASIEQIENSMGVYYLGWSETIDGHPIPGLAKPNRRFTKVARAHRLIERAAIRAEAKGQAARAKALRRALKHLPEF